MGEADSWLPLLARPADGQLQTVGQLPSVLRADGPGGVAAGGLRQDDDHLAVAVRPDRDAQWMLLGLDARCVGRPAEREIALQEPPMLSRVYNPASDGKRSQMRLREPSSESIVTKRS